MDEPKINPKECLVQVMQDIESVATMMMNLDEAHITLEEITLLQSKLSHAASEMTKLRTYMLNNL